MLSGATLRASEIAGTAVFKIVVSSDSIKNATATSHGRRRLLAADREKGTKGALMEVSRPISFMRCNYLITYQQVQDLHNSSERPDVTGK